MAKKKGDDFLVVVVDGREFPLDPGALSAVDEDRLRSVSASKLTISAVMQSLSSGVGGLSDVAAFCYLSESQQGRSPKWSEIAGLVKLTSDVDLRTAGGDDPE